MDLLFSPIDLYGQYVTHLALLASSISGGEEEEGGCAPFTLLLPAFSLWIRVLYWEEDQLYSAVCYLHLLQPEGVNSRRGGGAPCLLSLNFECLTINDWIIEEMYGKKKPVAYLFTTPHLV